MTLWTETHDGQGNRHIDVNFHRGQARAMASERRFVAVLAGTQGGKTSWGPIWLDREIERGGAGDYLAVSATYDLFKLKMLPALLDWFVHTLGIGEYHISDRVLEIPSRNARIILRSAESGSGLESSTAKAAWLDEAGMDAFTIASWEAVLRRLSLSRGRVLLTTTIYNIGWLKDAVYDPWDQGRREGREHPDIDVIQFDSTENPAFPKEEYERARATMPLWKFNMFYRGRFERPAGLIYDCFDEHEDVIPPFVIPADWPRYVGLDFGGQNTAAVLIAKEPATGTLYLYREYLAGGRTATEHTYHIMQSEPGVPTCVGGSHSEGQWRKEFASGGAIRVDGQERKVGGLPVREPPIRDVEVQIGRVYGALKAHEIKIFNTCSGVLDQLRSYARKVDAAGLPTNEIDQKASYHYLDGLRYLVAWLKHGRGVYV